MFRVYCHCSICQKYNAASHADILVFKAKQIELPADGVVEFTTYKRPPNVQRGRCSQCGQAAIEVFSMPLFPKLTMVPAGMFGSDVELPESKAHMFYESRVADASDDLPKYQGFMRSQLVFFKHWWQSRKTQ